jgi:formylglycine-generating enzyme required for sulfatase activity
LLDETLSAEEQPTIQAHLETCERCQKVLEHLAAGGATWDRTAENLTPQPVRDETALFNVVEKLQETPTSAEQTRAEGVTVPPDVDLSFLQPSQRLDALGRLDEYEILSVVGKGGFGIVLRAFDEELHRIVAIKVLAPEIASHGTARERFVREAKAAAAVAHENIVTIHRVEKKAKIPYLVMQFIGGVTLSEKIEAAGLLSVKEILRIGMQISEGLAAAHKHGIIHRDIKPGNILLENGVERVKITDFGLARLVDDASVTQSGTVAGTPMYMSPEQANGEPIDLRSDLFSLGSVLYVMCTGKAPFRASSTMAVMKRVCDETPRAIQESNPDIPVWLSDIVTKLHAKKPEDRYQTAKEVAELLGRHLADLQAGRGGSVSDRSAAPVTIDAATPVAHAPGSPKRWRSRWAVALPILAGMFVIAVVVGSRYLPRGDKAVVPVPVNPPFVPVFGGPDWRPLTDNSWKRFVGAAKHTPPGQGPERFILTAGTSMDTLDKLPRNFHLRMEVNLEHGQGTVRFHAQPRWDGKSPFPSDSFPKDGWFLDFIENQGDKHKLDAALYAKDPANANTIVASGIAKLGEWFYLEIIAKDEHADVLVNGHQYIKLHHGNGRVPPAGVLSLWNTGRNDSEIAFRNIEIKDLTAPTQPQRSIAGQWESDWGPVTLSHKPIEGTDPVPVTGFFQPEPDKKGTITVGSFDPVQGLLKITCAEPWRSGTSSAVLKASSDGNKLEGTWTNDSNQSGIWTMLRKHDSEPPSQPVPLYDAQLQTTRFGWLVHENDFSKTGFQNGRYFVAVTPGGSRHVGTPTGSQSEFACEVVGRITGSPTSMWGLRIQNAAHKWSLDFRLNGQQELDVRIGDAVDKEFKEQSLRKNPAIKAGEEFNKLTVISRRGRFEVYVNGVQIGDPVPADHVKMPVIFVLSAYSGDNKASRAEFERFTVWPADALPLEPGWVQLFNGKDLDGWHHPGTGGTWHVKEGLLASQSPITTLFSDRNDLGDFHLRAEARINGSGSAALFFRAGPDLAAKNSVAARPIGPSVELLGGSGGALQTGGVLTDKPISGRLITPGGEWFTLELIARGKYIITKVNGKIAVDYADADPNPRKGHIALQQFSPGTFVEFKKIEIKELPPAAPGWVQLFNGKNLDGWKTLTSPVKGAWEVVGDILIGRGGFLMLHTTRGDYENFKLRAEVKIRKGSLFLAARMPTPGFDVGYGLQSSYTDGGRTATGLTLFRKGPALVLASGTQPNKPDDWCKLEIVAEGNRLRTFVNGQFDHEYIDTQNTYPRGHVGLRLGQFSNEVQIRKVEIMALPGSPASPGLRVADATREDRYPAPDFSHAKPLFDDRFQDPATGWGSDKGEYYEVGHKDGRYFIALTPNGTRAQWCPAAPPGDFACEVVGRTTGSASSSWGLETQNRPGDRYLNFNLNSKQELEIIAAGKDVPTFMKIGPIQHRAIKPGDGFNKLLVVVRGGWTHIYVNGIAICEPLAIDFVKTPATFALVAHADKNSVSRAEFERFTLWSAENMPITSSPRRYRNNLGMEFAVVPKGKAWLGGGDGKEGNVQADIKDDFYLGAYEVTQEQWERVLGLKHTFHFSRNGEGKDALADVTDEQLKRFPAENVSWNECQLFLKKLNELDKKPGWEYRLPTEEEWEYACRGGPGDKLQSAFDFYLQEPTNVLLPSQANIRHDKGLNRPRPVGAYPPNKLGLHDMHGNVSEFTHNPQPVQDDDGNPKRNERGGGWTNDAFECRVTGSFPRSPTERFMDMGLRVALVPVTVKK